MKYKYQKHAQSVAETTDIHDPVGLYISIKCMSTSSGNHTDISRPPSRLSQKPKLVVLRCMSLAYTAHGALSGEYCIWPYPFWPHTALLAANTSLAAFVWPEPGTTGSLIYIGQVPDGAKDGIIDKQPNTHTNKCAHTYIYVIIYYTHIIYIIISNIIIRCQKYILYISVICNFY